MLHPFISISRHIQKKSVHLQMKGQALPEGVTVFSDINYLNDRSEYHNLDIYYPEGTKSKLPIIVSVHGGAFIGGDKFYNKEFGMRLALEGFVVVNINYDLAPDKTLTGMVNCLNKALKWIYENVEQYHGDKEQIFGLGDSAGGWQVLTYSIVNNSEKLRSIYQFNAKNPVQFRSLVLICPVANVRRAMDRHSKIKVFGTAVFRWKNKGVDYELTSIQDLIKYGNIPESLIITTPNDHYFYQSEELELFFRENNINHKFCSYINIENDINHCFNIMHPHFAESKIANKEIVDFLKR